MIRRPPRSTRTDNTLALHDALPIYHRGADLDAGGLDPDDRGGRERVEVVGDLREPHRRHAGLLRPAGIGEHPLDLRGVATPHRAQHPSDPHPDHLSLRTFLYKSEEHTLNSSH